MSIRIRCIGTIADDRGSAPIPDARELMSAVVRGRDEDYHSVYFFVNRHYLGNGKCTRTYTPTHQDKNAIAEVGEEVFRQVVRKCDGKETLYL